MLPKKLAGGSSAIRETVRGYKGGAVRSWSLDANRMGAQFLVINYKIRKNKKNVRRKADTNEASTMHEITSVI